MKANTISIEALSTITGGLSIPPTTGPTFPEPRPFPFPRPFPQPSPLPLPWPKPDPIDPRILGGSTGAGTTSGTK